MHKPNRPFSPDKAVSALDVSVQAQVLRPLDRIQQQLEIGILSITHDLRVASHICDRVIVMRNEEVVQSADAQQIFENPKHPYMRALLDTTPGKSFNFGTR